MLKQFIVRIAIFLSAVLFSILIILNFRGEVLEELQLQIYENLEDVALQNEIFIERELHTRHVLLENVAAEFSLRDDSLDSDSINSALETLTTFSDIHDFKRWGLITADGIAHTTDGYEVDVSGSDSYRNSMLGLSYITGTITDTVGSPDLVNIFSVPIFSSDNKVIGVLFATYLTEDFKNILNVNSFNGEGYSYIIRPDGTVITDSAQSPMYGTDNVFECILSFSSDNQDIVDRLKEAMSKSQSGYESFTTEGKRYMYYTPLDIHTAGQTWYMLTIVPAATLDAKIETLLFYQNISLLVVVTVMLLLFVYFIANYRKDAKSLNTLAYVDPLTGNDNYPAFLSKMRKMHETEGYMISADLNEFKLINNLCGISKGNEVLVAIWDIISKSLKENEVAAHINADHYVMFLTASSKVDVVERIVSISNRISDLSKKLDTISIFAYFGIYKTTSSADPEDSYTKANQAKKLVRGNTKKNWAFYEEVDFETVAESKQLEDSFADAIANREFEVWYQPKCTAGDLAICGAEALIRWRKPDGTLISPARFIPLFETNGMIVTLDQYVFETVCSQQKKWKDNGRALFPVSVNISRASLHYNHLVRRYTDILEKYGLSPELVPLEITESATVSDTQIKKMIERFHKAGFILHLDDFGNGYSSLAALYLMHFDTLKLDKSLIDFIGTATGEQLPLYTIQLARSLGMHVIAEGVETEEQARFLKDISCDEIQGYYFSKPMPLEEFEKFY